MRTLTLLAIIAFCLQIVNGQEKRSRTDNDKAVPKEGKKFVPAIPTTANENQANTHKQEKATADDPPNYFTRLFSPENLPNIGLFLAGVAGICIAMRTLRAIETQSILQARSIALQERAMEQWVDYGDWDSGLGSIDIGDTKLPLFYISFVIINPTKFPMRLPHPRFIFKHNTEEYIPWVRIDCLLLPERSETISVSFPIIESQAAVFREIGIKIEVEGDIAHVGSLGKPVAQRMAGIISCHPEGTTFSEMTPEGREGEQSKGQPN